ncbi:MAG: hypothetical protein QXH91_00945 [Candidatus Bathyarchaeia archaeon]|nr:hypothetical protein [Candidatus Bathyarchaeota archaeon]
MEETPLKTAIEYAKKYFERSGYGLRKVLVTTAETNILARRLYEKLGFRKWAELKDLFEIGKTALTHILTLRP